MEHICSGVLQSKQSTILLKVIYDLLLGNLSPWLGTLVFAGFLQKIYFCSRDPLCVFTQLGLELDYKAAFCSRIPLAVHELFRQTE